MNSRAGSTESKAKLLHQALFSLNIAFALTYSLFAYDGTSYMAIHAAASVRSFLEAFSHLLFRVAPLVVNRRTKSEYLHSVLIREGTFLLLVLGIAFLLYVFVRLPADRTARPGPLLSAIPAVTALIAVPGCWLYIVHATWRSSDLTTFWGRYGYFFILEAALAVGFIYLVRYQPIWRGTVLFALHYAFWVFLVLRDGNWLVYVTVSIPLSFVFPCSGIAWLRYVQQSPPT